MKPEQEVLEGIRGLDLESVKLRLMDEEVGEGWTRQYADSVEIGYKNYLSMLVKYQEHAEDILLSKDVDEFWHTHILQTIKYVEDCERVFGAYLHHSPHVGERTAEVRVRRVELAEKTRMLYAKEFGAANAASAWYGAGRVDRSAVEGPQAALSSYTVRADNAALSSYAVRADNAALSSYAVRADNAALSSYTVRADNAALSSYAVRADNAALSSYAVREDGAALSSYAIRTQDAALSSYAIRSRG